MQLYKSPESFKFYMYIDSQGWTSSKSTKKKDVKRRRLRGSWTTLFNEKFHEENKVCVLKFTRNTVEEFQEKIVISSQEKQVVNSRDVCIKKDPGDAPKKK